MNRDYDFKEKKEFEFDENDCEHQIGINEMNESAMFEDEHHKQKHTHEFLGSVKIAERNEDPHNHRFAGVTGEAICLPCREGHYHKFEFKTDFYEDHFHYAEGKTGVSIEVGDGRHVHFDECKTSFNDGHRHEFEFATLIDNPIGD